MTEKRFDQEAASWDESPLKVNLVKDVAETIIKRVSLKEDMDVLDFGCGTGLLIFHLRPFVRSLTGVDSSRGMLEVLGAKIRRQEAENVRACFLDSASGDATTGSAMCPLSTMKDMYDIIKESDKSRHLLTVGMRK